MIDKILEIIAIIGIIISVLLAIPIGIIIVFILAKELSNAIDHLDGTNLVLLLAITCKLITKNKTKI